MYLSINVGLHIFPLKLGAFLLAPRKQSNQSIFNEKDLFHLRFYTSKIKLHTNSQHYQKFSVGFEKGNSYLLVLPDERENIAQLIAGYSRNFGTKKWRVKINDQHRLGYHQWASARLDRYYVQAHQYPDVKFIDYLGGELDIEFLAEYPCFSFIFERRKFLNDKVHVAHLKTHEFIILQIAYLLIHKPSLVVIDPSVIDLPYPQIHEAMNHMTRELSESIIIGVSHYNSQHTYFDHVYHYKEN